jgi:ABC-type transport system involved in multi-copper enzyme maturation permease subunit
MSPNGVVLVAKQEFRIRLRTGRWRWLLGAWVLVIGGFTVLLDLSMETGYALGPSVRARGVPLFGFLMMFVLGMVLVVSPALTSQSINGDRERGTLATLQVTRLGPAEIALGKLLAGWGVGLVALALTLPFAGYALTRGGLTVARIAAVYAVVAILIGVVCAVSQALSALLARSITSALLSYLAVAALTVGTLIAFTLIAPLITEVRTSTSPDAIPYRYEVVRYDRVWWLLAPNPFVVVADAAPHVPPRITASGDLVMVDDYDPLSSIGRTVRDLRIPPREEPINYDGVDPRPAVWPYGLAFNVLLGVGAVAVTAARLRTPSRRVARGVRIA